MDRRLIAAVFCFCVAGCALSRSAAPDTSTNHPITMADGLPIISESINRVDYPRDNAAQRAKLDTLTTSSGLPPLPTDPAPAAPPPAASTDNNSPAGRPAPYATQAPASGRPVAPTALVKTVDETQTPRPAPASDAAPASARPRLTEVDKPPTAVPASPLVASNAPPVQEPTTPAPLAPPPPTIEVAPPSEAKPLPAIPPLLAAVPPDASPAGTDGPPPVTVSAGNRTPKTDTAVTPAGTTAGATAEVPNKLAARRELPLGEGKQAAMVGSEVITLATLRRHLKEQIDKFPPEQKADPEWPRYARMMTDQVLNKLIERTLVVQALKKQIKDPKNLQGVYDSIDKGWVEHELPPLLRVENCANIHELKRKYAEKGKSLDLIREDWRLDTVAREYMMSKITPKLIVSLPDRQQYYTAHLTEFNRPAQITWREITIDNAKSANRAEARKKIDAILVRLGKGEDFATIAKNESHGATAKEGGKWEIAPGGYAVPEINEALASLPEGGVSTVLEAPGGFHIVSVEEKRQAGPARFDEVSDQIKETIVRQKFNKLAAAFVDNLKSHTIVTTMFDERPKSDPSAVRASGEQPTPNR